MRIACGGGGIAGRRIDRKCFGLAVDSAVWLAAVYRDGENVPADSGTVQKAIP